MKLTISIVLALYGVNLFSQCNYNFPKNHEVVIRYTYLLLPPGATDHLLLGTGTHNFEMGHYVLESDSREGQGNLEKKFFVPTNKESKKNKPVSLIDEEVFYKTNTTELMDLCQKGKSLYLYIADRNTFGQLLNVEGVDEWFRFDLIKNLGEGFYTCDGKICKTYEERYLSNDFMTGYDESESGEKIPKNSIGEIKIWYEISIKAFDSFEVRPKARFLNLMDRDRKKN